MTNRRLLAGIAAAALGASVLPAIANAAPTPDASPSATASATPSTTPSASATPSADATPSASATPTAGATATPPVAEMLPLSWGGATCADPFQASVEGDSVTVSYCYQAEDGTWKPLTQEIADANSDTPGATTEMAIYTGESDNIADLVKPGTEVQTVTLNDDGTLRVDIPADKFVAVSAAGVPLNQAPSFIYGPSAPETDPTPSQTPTATAEPTPTPTPTPTIDPTVVATFADSATCTDTQSTYEPGETYTFYVCNQLNEPVAGAELRVYSTANGDIAALEQGTLVENVTTDENGAFRMTVPTDGYIGAVADSGAAMIIGPDPRGGNDNGTGGPDKGDAPGKSTNTTGGKSGGKGLPKTGF